MSCLRKRSGACGSSRVLAFSVPADSESPCPHLARYHRLNAQMVASAHYDAGLSHQLH